MIDCFGNVYFNYGPNGFFVRYTMQRLHELTDPWGHVTTFNYNGSSNPGPLGRLKEVLYSNGAKGPKCDFTTETQRHREMPVRIAPRLLSFGDVYEWRSNKAAGAEA